MDGVVHRKLEFVCVGLLRACAFDIFIHNLASVIFPTATTKSANTITRIIITIFIIVIPNSGSVFFVPCCFGP